MFALSDGFPVSPGHTLDMPKRLVATWFEVTGGDQVAVLEPVDEVKAQQKSWGLALEFHSELPVPPMALASATLRRCDGWNGHLDGREFVE